MATPTSSIELTARGRVVLALAAASALGAWLSGDVNVRLAAAALLGPLLVDFARKPRELRRITVQVAPRRVVAGAPFRDEVRLVHGGRRPLHEVEFAEEGARSSPAMIDTLAPHASHSTVLACHGQVRGHRLERVFQLATEWPLGLFRAAATAVVATDFVAEPRRVRLTASIARAVDDQLTVAATRRELPGDDFHSLREHRPDEDARRVHARRSAAFGSLVHTVVRGREPHHIGIVLDLRRPPGRSLNLGQRRFEWSLGAAATLLDRFGGDQTEIDLFVIGSRTEHMSLADRQQLRDALTLFAELATSPHRTLEPNALADAATLERVFWIPAGGYLADAEHSALGHRVQLLGSDGA